MEVTELTNEAFFTGIYIALMMLLWVAAWSLVCHLINRGIS